MRLNPFILHESDHREAECFEKITFFIKNNDAEQRMTQVKKRKSKPIEFDEGACHLSDMVQDILGKAWPGASFQ